MSNGNDWFCFFIGVIFAAGAFGSGCYSCSQKMEHRHAIEAGVGRWVINEETGVKKFEYGVKQ